MNTEPRLLTLGETATRLGISDDLVLVMARSGELPAVKIGASQLWRVDRLRLEDHFEDLKHKAATWTEPPETGEPLEPERAGKRRYRKRGTYVPADPRPLPEGARWVTVWDAAELMSVSRTTVINDITEGTLRASKSGRVWQVSIEDVMTTATDRMGGARGSRLIDGVIAIVERTLGERWPQVSFSVFEDRERSSVLIGWIDGPTQGEVGHVARRFEVWPRGQPEDHVFPLISVYPGRTLSSAFKRDVVAKIEELTGGPFDPDERYSFTFAGHRFSASGWQLIWQVSCFMSAA